MKALIRDFSYNLDSLRGFISLVDTLITTHQNNFYENKIEYLIPVVLAVQKLSPELFEGKELPEEKARKRYKGNFELSDIEESKEGKTVSVSIPDDEGEQIESALKELHTAVQSKRILYEGSLMTLISSVEWFISQLIQNYYEKFPDALGSKDKFFSLDDLKSFDDIKDAQGFLVDSKVDDLMRKSFSDWIKFIKENLSLSMGYLKDSEKLLVEAFQRRHLIVHNGGIINTIYLSKVDDELTKNLKLGSKIEIDIDYLVGRINLFEQGCILIGLEAWKKQDSLKKERAKITLNLIEKHIKEERWLIAESLSFFLINDKKMDERDQVMGKLYYWFTVKRQERWNEIQEEVAKADFSAKDKILQLTHFAILDELDSIFTLLEGVIKSEELTCEEINKNPIFSVISADPRYKLIAEKYSNKSTKSSRKRRTTPNKPIKRIRR